MNAKHYVEWLKRRAQEHRDEAAAMETEANALIAGNLKIFVDSSKPACEIASSTSDAATSPPEAGPLTVTKLAAALQTCVVDGHGDKLVKLKTSLSRGSCSLTSIVVNKDNEHVIELSDD